MDKDKIHADEEMAKGNVQEFGNKTMETIGGDNDKVTSEDVRHDADQPLNTASTATGSSLQTKE